MKLLLSRRELQCMISIAQKVVDNTGTKKFNAEKDIDDLDEKFKKE